MALERQTRCHNIAAEAMVAYSSLSASSLAGCVDPHFIASRRYNCMLAYIVLVAVGYDVRRTTYFATYCLLGCAAIKM
eukprot:scaffold111538_cov47-Attheya_sp.AAC.1